MTDVDEIFEERRRREIEHDRKLTAAREAKAAEEKERLKRAPISVGNGRVYTPIE